MFCSNCGHENTNNDRFCSQCGKELITEEIGETEPTEDQELADMVGKNYDYYKLKWSEMGDPASSVSWNWAAFLLGIFWLGYRKMYKLIFIIFGLFLLSDIIEMISGYHVVATYIVNYLPLATYIYVGLYANALYYRHTQAKLEKANAMFPEGGGAKFFGGPSRKGVAGAVGILAGYLVIYLIIFSIFSGGSIVFGTEEGTHGINGIKDEFTTDEVIYYEVNFGERADSFTVDVYVLLEEEGVESIYAQFQEQVEPSWEGFYNNLYDPYYDYLEPGTYIVRVYRDNELLSEGSFEMRGALH